MIQNWWTLFFNSVYEGPNGEWQVCTECGDCNACEGCIDCSGGCPSCFSEGYSEKYIFWVATAQPGWACEREIEPNCRTGTPQYTCRKIGQTGQCVREAWDFVEGVCEGVSGPQATITSFGNTNRGFFSKRYNKPPGPHPCGCSPQEECSNDYWYTCAAGAWCWRMPCNGPCGAGCSDCNDPGGCYYLNNSIQPGCEQDCRCAFGVGNGPSYEERWKTLQSTHVISRSTKYSIGGFGSLSTCDPELIEEYPNDNGPDVIIGSNDDGVPCQNITAGSCGVYGISALLPRGFADENGEFIWEDMRFIGYEASTYELDQNNQVVLACEGTSFYEVEAVCPCGRMEDSDGCGAGCACSANFSGCGSLGRFLYYTIRTDEEIKFIQIGKSTMLPKCRDEGLDFEEKVELYEINAQGGYAVNLSGGIFTEDAPQLQGASCMELSPKTFTFKCPTA